MFNPQAGHEQAEHGPALVLSPKAYNEKVGLAILCPITTQVKGYPFKVLIPEESEQYRSAPKPTPKMLIKTVVRLSCQTPVQAYHVMESHWVTPERY